MKYVYLILNWGFGVLFALVGAASMIKSPLAGLSLILIASLLLPPVRNFVYSKTNKEISIKARGISILVLFMAFGVFSGIEQDRREQELAEQKAKERAEKEAQLREERINYFTSNRDKIISSIEGALREKNYQEIISKYEKYLVSGDEELDKLISQAKNELLIIRNAEETKNILAELKTIPAEKYEKNKRLYRRLVNLNPDNEKYKNKYDHYSEKLTEKIEKEKREKERRKKERETRIAKFGEPPTQSAWDGSYYPVERYLKKVANDPDSIEIDGCTDVYHTDGGWLVGCDYRGRNAFGGMVRQSNWFTIVHNQVVKVHDASAYSQ